MRPITLIMQAFGSYGKRTTVDFTKPIQNMFLITGDTGSGKSTIFDALVFALYGEASSCRNRKDGTELQSQYADLSTEPFVQLTFTERVGETELEYTVKRVPRHIRPLKKGKGTKEEGEAVTLILPDGTEYPQKEADKKLEEIVGLTKGQFMQVAMIAQGEFMDLLRSKPEDKKIIFRKLFNTGLYQRIVEELARRRKEKQAELGQLRTVCQTEAGHVVIPEDYENAAQLLTFRNRVITSEQMSVTDLEGLVEALDAAVAYLKNRQQELSGSREECERAFIAGRDALTTAKQLLPRFQELEQAEQLLRECAGEEEEIASGREQIGRITAAYEIKEIHDRLTEAEKQVSDTQRELDALQERLPGLEADYDTALKESDIARSRLDQELNNFSKVEERVENALEILKKIRSAQKDVQKNVDASKMQRETVRNLRQKGEELEQNQSICRQRMDTLADAPVRMVLWENRCREAETIDMELNNLQKLEKDVQSRTIQAKKDADAFAAESDAYNRMNAEYQRARTAFLNAQAGLIAREQLLPGMPCPVCGSRVHPAPCVLPEQQVLSREELDALEKQVALHKSRQEAAAAAANRSSTVLQEKQSQLDGEMSRLWGKMADAMGEAPCNASVSDAVSAVRNWYADLKKKLDSAKADAELLERTQAMLSRGEQEAKELSARLRIAEDAVHTAEETLTESRARLATLEQSRDYATEEEAMQAQSAAEKIKRACENANRDAGRQESQARQELEKARTGMGVYSAQLPGYREKRNRLNREYENAVVQKALPGWKQVTEQFPKDAPLTIQKRIEDFSRKQTAALSRRESALAAIGDRERPVPEELTRQQNEAKADLDRAERLLKSCESMLDTNLRAASSLSSKLRERGRMAEQAKRMDDLYNLLAGKVSGSRMDIETFVQRYYLEKILHRANRRFREMTGGQFELRMYDLEKAGEGKNHGLDLMVYSAVTGKTREIGTLSGGESFMAALAMALGMADQIQASSSVINMDMMFIDEGFGSLSENARNQAVRVLKQMAGDEKLIGIISHVTELKQELGDQLIVTRDDFGSHILWQNN